MIPIVGPDAPCRVVNNLFIHNPKLEGIAVAEPGKSPSLVMRSRFYQLLGTQYGYNLYMGRPVSLVMNCHPLVVQYEEPITEVSIQAMNRAEEELYDGVLVAQEEALHGFVSIRRLLLEVADIRAEMAVFMNALTGLPGNRIIDDRLQQSTRQKCFSMLYIDLDHFKSYNDSYGFKMGDGLIQATASLLREQFSGQGSFLGHIGGDDFIAILNHHEYQDSCDKVIEGFEQMKQSFYNDEDLKNNYVRGENRSGSFGAIPLVSISIAVVTNQQREFDSMDEIVDEATRMKKMQVPSGQHLLCQFVVTAEHFVQRPSIARAKRNAQYSCHRWCDIHHLNVSEIIARPYPFSRKYCIAPISLFIRSVAVSGVFDAMLLQVDNRWPVQSLIKGKIALGLYHGECGLTRVQGGQFLLPVDAIDSIGRIPHSTSDSVQGERFRFFIPRPAMQISRSAAALEISPPFHDAILLENQSSRMQKVVQMYLVPDIKLSMIPKYSYHRILLNACFIDGLHNLPDSMIHPKNNLLYLFAVCSMSMLGIVQINQMQHKQIGSLPLDRIHRTSGREIIQIRLFNSLSDPAVLQLHLQTIKRTSTLQYL